MGIKPEIFAGGGRLPDGTRWDEPIRSRSIAKAHTEEGEAKRSEAHTEEGEAKVSEDCEVSLKDWEVWKDRFATLEQLTDLETPISADEDSSCDLPVIRLSDRAG